MKALNNPPELVKKVATWVMMLKPVDDVDYKGGWNAARTMMNNPGTFINNLKNFGPRINKIKNATADSVKK